MQPEISVNWIKVWEDEKINVIYDFSLFNIVAVYTVPITYY